MVSQHRRLPSPHTTSLHRGQRNAFFLVLLIVLLAATSQFLNRAALDRPDPVFAAARLAGAPSPPSNTWLEQFKATADDAGAGYRFGTAVAIDGDTALIGAWGDEGSSGLPHQDVGAAFIFERTGAESNDWQLVTKLTASDEQAADNFGTAVALDGDTALVGAHMEDSGPGDPLSNAGAVYVYQRDHGGPDAWGEVTKLTPNDTAAGDMFGFSLALDDDTALVGAWLKNSDLAAAGAAYIFQRDWGGDDAWGQVTNFTGAQRYGHFGVGLALDQNTAIIAADNEDDGDGAAYVYRRNPDDVSIWEQIARLTPGDSGGNANFGWGVALDGDTALIGAYSDDEEANNAGAAYIFQRDWGGADAWGQVARLSAADAQAGDWFGMDVALEQDTALVGAYREDGGGPFDPFLDYGAAYVFQRHVGGENAWGQVVKQTASDPTADARFGSAVALDEDTILVGAQRADSGNGTAYWFEPVPQANLALTKSTLTTGPLLPGQAITYTLTFTNTGPGVAKGVAITDTLPVALSGTVDVRSSVPLTNTTGPPHLRWTTPDLPPGAGGAITLTGVVSPLLSADTSLTNVAGASTTSVNLSAHDSDAVDRAVTVPRVSFARAAYTTGEGAPAGAATITVTLDAPNPFAGVTVGYETRNGSAIAGRDYVTSRGHLTIAAGQSGAAFTVPIIDDNVDRNGGFLWLTLGDTHGAAPGALAEATLTILEDDRAGVTVWPTALTLGEGLPGQAYTVRLDTRPTAAVTVTIAPDSQLNAGPDELLFDSDNWDVGQSVLITAVEDAATEGVHGGRITHLSRSDDQNYDGLAVDEVIVTIHDNEYNVYLPAVILSTP